MERLRSILFVVDVIVALVAGTVGFLWSLDVINVEAFEAIAASVNAIAFGGVKIGRILSVLVGLWILVTHALYLICAPFFSKYDTHIRCKLNDGEVSVTVAALEESLSRIVAAMSALADARVSVYRERKHVEAPLRIFASCTAYDGVSVREVTERVRELIKMRLGEVVELPHAPLIEICVSRIVARELRKEPKKKPAKEGALGAEFRGPEYPIDAEQEE
ncbi:MAG: hypothetical protein HZA54_20865 [Planctomycetes bacterium]|nr:hypothetical protein [Planctomycetota bacterium]